MFLLQFTPSGKKVYSSYQSYIPPHMAGLELHEFPKVVKCLATDGGGSSQRCDDGMALVCFPMGMVPSVRKIGTVAIRWLSGISSSSSSSMVEPINERKWNE